MSNDRILTHQRLFIAKRIATQIRAVEASIDATTAEAAAFAEALPAAREQAGMIQSTGLDAALEASRAAVAALQDAQRLMLEAHGQLNVAREEAGLRTVMFGSFVICPDLSTGDAPRAVTKRAA